MRRMFQNAKSFNQNMCAWSDDFPYSSAEKIFLGSDCTYQYDPVESQKGPFCASGCTEQGPSSQTFVDGYFELQSAIGYCLDVPNSNTNNGIDLIVSPCNGAKSQQWLFADGGYIRSRLNHNKCIDPQGPSMENRLPVQLWDCKDNYTFQMWSMDSGRISSKHSPGQCIDVRESEGKVVMWECHGGQTQKLLRRRLFRRH
mmetsp:Transcript_6375/g.11349  ORF Transcript_6375/g.11349 Transcript_6375/m.11349 type:complete len:200 (-) Transcript_6375:35-634(-)